MRVLRTKGSDQNDWIPCLCTHHGEPYAILSHRWLEDSNHEILFADIEEIDKIVKHTSPIATADVVKNPQYAGVLPSAKPGFKKLQGAAQQALKDGFEYIWIDTCCIDKNSSAELSEAINSMWLWYRTSNVCYAYLMDVPGTINKVDDFLFAESQWWRRGWTLQELLAPRELRFFTHTWSPIGDKKYMDLDIGNITGIDPNVINGTVSLESTSIAQRMSWASGRQTTRVEDMAYSLMGLFAVNMPLLYGEGERAFLRLQQEIMKDSDDETIFAWKDESVAPGVYCGLLAMRPSAFASCRKTIRYEDAEHRAPYSVTNKGLSITLRLAQIADEEFLAMLHCADPGTGGENVNIYLKKISRTGEQYARIRCQEWARTGSSIHKEARAVYIKQSHDQRPAYKTLSKVNRNIRLVRIVPTEDISIVKVSLTESEIDTSRYTALSYVRGDPGKRRAIWVNSEEVQVTESIFSFLQKARQTLTDELYWVFSICIPQADLVEKTHLVPFMSQIVSHATKVVVWLGPVDTEHAARLQSFVPDQLQTHMGARNSTLDAARIRRKYDNETNTDSSTIRNIAAHPYWKRSWILQELYLARDVVIELETIRITLDGLTRMYNDALREIKQHGMLNEDELSNMGRILQFCHTKRQSQDLSIPKLVKFETLLAVSQFQASADPRDRVYSLVRISDLDRKLDIDYNQPLMGVFFNVVACLREDITLTILPLLLQALDIRLQDGQLPIDDSAAPVLRFALQQIAEPLSNIGTRNDMSSGGLAVDAAATGDLVCFASQHDAKSSGGIVFARVDSGFSNSHPGQGAKYKVSKLCKQDTFGECSFIDLPSVLEDALMNTYGVLENTRSSILRLRIIADKKGLIALGFCMQKIDCNRKLQVE